MPPRKRSTPSHGALRVALEADLAALELPGHRALVELARVLADDLDRPRLPCVECGGVDGPDPRTALRYADALEALGIGSIPQQEPADEFVMMVKGFHAGRP